MQGRARRAPCTLAVCLLALILSSPVRPSDGAEAGARDEMARLEKSGLAESLEAADAADLLIEVLTAAGKVRDPEVTDLARRSLRIREAALGPDDLRVARSRTALADILFESAVSLEAITLYQQSLATHEKVLGPDDPEVGKRVLELGIAIKNKGDRKGSKPYMERALAIFEKAYGPEHMQVAKALNSLANTLKHTGEYDEAIARAGRAVRIMEKLSPDSEEAGMYAVNLATIYRLVGDYSKARPLYEQGVRIAEKQEGGESYGHANALNSLAILYREMGKFTEARSLYEKALGIWERTSGPESADAAMAVRNLGSLFLRLGDLDRAQAYNERALSIWEKTNGPDHPSVANVLQGLGAVWLQKNEPARAVPLLQRALRIQEESRGPNHPSVGTSLADIGSAQLDMDRPEEALTTLEKALAQLEQSVGPDHFYTAATNHYLGRTLSRLGKTDAARQRFQRAIAICEKTYGPEHYELAAPVLDLGRLQWSAGSDQEAWSAAMRADAINRRHFRLSEAGLSEREALQLEASRTRGLDLALSILVSGKGAVRQAAGAASRSAQAFDAVIQGRAMVLDALARRHRASMLATTPETAALLANLEDKRERLARLATRGPDEAHPETYIATLQEAQEAKERAERELSARVASPTGIATGDREQGLTEVLGLIPVHTVLVSYVLYNQIDRESSSTGTPAYLAFVLKAGSREPVAIPLGRAADVERAVTRWKAAAETPPKLSGAEDGAYRSAGEELRARIWDPVASRMGAADLVMLVPDGMLNLVSFGSLPVSEESYLLESAGLLHYLSAERDLARMARARTASNDLLAIGGPDFARRSATSSSGTDSRPVFRSVLPRCGHIGDARFDPLPASQAEARELAALWSDRSGGAQGKSRVVTLTGADATESAFKSSASKYRVLHVATHGFSMQDECTAKPAAPAADARSMRLLEGSPLLLTGLVFAGAGAPTDRPAEEDDGFLTAEEVSSLDLANVEWAVLSACQTGLGKVISGEGVLGLRRAFEVAGARTLIMSLWKVEDNATLAWMRALYEARLAGLSTAAASRKAGLSLLGAQRSKRRSTHPFYWGGFVAAGDWR